ncbi:hypothetical protein GAS19_30265 (plasmid) [Burkholderia glumae]|nr:hypothetical protein GAS19_30265 [Burkholderia glumae]
MGGRTARLSRATTSSRRTTTESAIGCSASAWPMLLEQYRREALGASLLAVYGIWQTDGTVRHLVAKRLEDRSALLGGLRVESHDFH